MNFEVRNFLLTIFIAIMLVGCSEDPPGGAQCIDKTNLFQNLNNANLKNSINTTDWINANIATGEGKLLRIRTITGAVTERTKKYRVIYRIDPRFSKPVIYIASYNYNTNTFEPDWYNVLNPTTSSFNVKRAASVAYAQGTSAGRQNILVSNGDAVNITLLNVADFYRNFSSISTDYNVSTEGATDLSLLYTGAGGLDNSIIAGDIGNFCTGNPKCINSNPYGTPQWKINDIKQFYAGINSLVANPSTLPICSVNLAANTACAHNQGYGMVIKVGTNTFKEGAQKFISTGGKEIYYFQPDLNGNITFDKSVTTDVFSDNIWGMFPFQFMPGWPSNWSSTSTLEASLGNTSYIPPLINFALGRYLMEIEVGSSTGQAMQNKIKNVTYRYGIKGSNGVITDMGTFTTPLYETNSPTSGNLYIKIINDYPELQGNVVFNIQTYTGSNGVSTVLEDYLINPLKEQIHSTTALFYGILTSNGSFIKFVYACLILYITIYGLCFLMGVVQMTAHDLFYRSIKIIFVTALFSPMSWSFFNTYLFGIFFDAADQLIRMTTNTTSTIGHTFGFIDPILDKYTRPRFWQIMYVYTVHISSGFTFIAVIIIWGVLNFLKALVEILVGYLLAIVSLSVVVALAPFFITAILFERSRMLFDNWLGIMFGLVMQPTIIMILFLLADQMSSDMLIKGIVDCCWGTYYTSKFSMTIGSINIEYIIFTIKYYIPNRDGGMIELTTALTSGLLFFSISKLAKGLVDFAQTITDALTGQAASAGNPRAANVIGSMMDDAYKVGWKYNPVTKATARGVNEKILKPAKRGLAKFGRFMKEEVMDRAKDSIKEGTKESLNKVGKKIGDAGKFVKREVGDRAVNSMYEGLEIKKRSELVKSEFNQTTTAINSKLKEGYDATVGRAAASVKEGFVDPTKQKIQEKIVRPVNKAYDASIGQAKRSITEGMRDENSEIMRNIRGAAAKTKATYNTVSSKAKGAYQTAATTSRTIVEAAKEGVNKVENAPRLIQEDLQQRLVNPWQDKINRFRQVVDEAGKKFDEEWASKQRGESKELSATRGETQVSSGTASSDSSLTDSGAAPAPRQGIRKVDNATQNITPTDRESRPDTSYASQPKVKKSPGIGERTREGIREGFDTLGKYLDETAANMHESVEPVVKPIRDTLKAIKDAPEAAGSSLEKRVKSFGERRKKTTSSSASSSLLKPEKGKDESKKD